MYRYPQAQYSNTWTCGPHRKSGLTTQTHITPPQPSRPWFKSLPTPQLHHPHPCNPNTDTRPRLLLFFTGLVKPKPNPNPLIPSPPTPPQRKHIHISHTPQTPLIPRTTLIHSTSATLDTIPEPSVQPTCPALTTTTPHPFPAPALSSPSDPRTTTLYQHTPMQHKQQYTEQSQRPPHPHRVLWKTHRHSKNDHMTTDTTQGHRPSSKSERNLIILQVNIN